MTVLAGFIAGIAREFDVRTAKGARHCRAWTRGLGRLGSAAYAVRTGSFTPKPPAFRDSGKRPMVLALRPPVRAIPVRTRERYDNVLVRVPVRDRRGVTRFVRSRANQCGARECTDNPPHDIPLLYFASFLALGHSHNRPSFSACQWASLIIKQSALSLD
jgi:hypothetical protein